MKRLVDRGLIFADLMTVETPVMRERYNAALDKLIGRTTDLADFHIDLSGYSPEVADELGDPDYLNHNGCNRQFILLSVEQRTCPLLQVRFSTSRTILRQFIDDNFSQLVALTSRDAVIGELDNSTWRIDDVEDLVTIRNITVRAETANGLIADARALERAIDHFQKSDTDWWSDSVLNELCRLAERVGDIRHNPVIPDKLEYRNGNFFTSHFGGIYVFANIGEPVVVTCDPDFDAPVPGDYVHIRMADRKKISRFLHDNDLVENILDIDYLDSEAMLEDRVDFFLADRLSRLDRAPDLAAMSRTELQRAARRHTSGLPAEFETLSSVLKSLKQGGQPIAVGPKQPGYFYFLRANPHADRDLINHLLARLTPHDFRQMFICNKDLFYDAYRTWPDALKTFVANVLERTYLSDKQALREDLYGVRRRPVARPWSAVSAG